jgi:hypothetical protein
MRWSARSVLQIPLALWESLWGEGNGPSGSAVAVSID